LVTTDDMSGYWNLLLYPDMYGIAACELDDELYYFRAMAFGFAPPACWVYTLLKQEVYRPLRAAGWDLAYLIDDCLAAARSEGAAHFMARLLVCLLTALGFTLGAKKCVPAAPHPESEAGSWASKWTHSGRSSMYQVIRYGT
jgi:hypothetical protein